MTPPECRCHWGVSEAFHCPVHNGPPPAPPPTTSDASTPHWPRTTTGWLSKLGAWVAEGLRRR